MQDGVRAPSPPPALRPSAIANASAVGRHFGRSREWGRQLLRQWHEEQKVDGLPRVVKRGGVIYTTVAVLNHYAPRRDRALENRVAALEADLLRAFSRIAELERRLPRR